MSAQTHTGTGFEPRRHPVENDVKTRLTPSSVVPRKGRRGSADGVEEKGERLRERLSNPDAVLSRSDLAALGYERRAVDAIFRVCPVEKWEGYSRPLIRVADFLEWRDRRTFGALAMTVRDRRLVKIEDRVIPGREAAA